MHVMQCPLSEWAQAAQVGLPVRSMALTLLLLAALGLAAGQGGVYHRGGLMHHRSAMAPTCSQSHHPCMIQGDMLLAIGHQGH